MQTVTGRTSFRILGSHGVPEAEIKMLETRFGTRIPANVVGPDDVIAWGLAVLPWTHLRQVVAAWVRRAAKKARLLDDRRMTRLLALLDRDEPDPEATDALAHDLDQLMMTLARVRGVDMAAGRDGVIDRTDIDDEFRAWACAFAGAMAVVESLSGPFSADVAECAQGAIQWALSQEHPDLRPYFVDDAIKDVATALTRYVGTWVIPGRAS